jgi:hypothetical protein
MVISNADLDPDTAYHFDADPDPAYHVDADPDSTFQFDADPDPQHWFSPKFKTYRTLHPVSDTCRTMTE